MRLGECERQEAQGRDAEGRGPRSPGETGPPAGAWETSWRLWGPGPGPPSEAPRRPATSPCPPAGPAPRPGASPRTSLLCRKDTLRMTASRVFSSPSFVPLLAAFMSCVIWAEAEGLSGMQGGPGDTRHYPGPPDRATHAGSPERLPPAGCWQLRPRAGLPQGLQGRGSRRGGLPGDFLTQISPLGVQLRTRCDTGKKPRGLES